MKNIFRIIVFISAAFFIVSCSDWSEDPSTVSRKKVEEAEPIGVLMSTNFPKNVTSFIVNNDSIVNVGTSDGGFIRVIILAKVGLRAVK